MPIKTVAVRLWVIANTNYDLTFSPVAASLAGWTEPYAPSPRTVFQSTLYLSFSERPAPDRIRWSMTFLGCCIVMLLLGSAWASDGSEKGVLDADLAVSHDDSSFDPFNAMAPATIAETKTAGERFVDSSCLLDAAAALVEVANLLVKFRRIHFVATLRFDIALLRLRNTARAAKLELIVVCCIGGCLSYWRSVFQLFQLFCIPGCWWLFDDGSLSR